ncbi:MAG TPA: hypothetical protein VL993_15970 [Stellaceae bacterium]|nr:hypothetical protein [Stellaceae bacterium]
MPRSTLRPQRTTAPPRKGRHWSRLAALARPKLEGLRFGGREIALKATAQSFGVNPQTLRRALAALKFVEQLESEPFLKKLSLRATPVAAIEHIARWYAYDRGAALRAARRLSEGEYTVAALAAAEASARNAARADGVGRALLHRCRSRVGPVLRAQLAAYEMDARGPRRGDEPSVDFRFRPPGEERWTIAAIIMGPYRDQARYAIRLGDWIVRALGLSTIYGRVVLIVPTASLEKQCHAWMRANAVPASAFDIQVITPDP